MLLSHTVTSLIERR